LAILSSESSNLNADNFIIYSLMLNAFLK
jgi:hypothetical protein